MLTSSRRDLKDERSVIIGLLPAGRALQVPASRISEQLISKLAMSPAEISALRTQLTHLLAQLT